MQENEGKEADFNSFVIITLSPSWLPANVSQGKGKGKKRMRSEQRRLVLGHSWIILLVDLDLGTDDVTLTSITLSRSAHFRHHLLQLVSYSSICLSFSHSIIIIIIHQMASWTLNLLDHYISHDFLHVLSMYGEGFLFSLSGCYTIFFEKSEAYYYHNCFCNIGCQNVPR